MIHTHPVSPATGPRRPRVTARALWMTFVAAVVAALGMAIAQGGAGAVSTYSFWTASTTPKNLADPDRQSVELGLRFRTGKAGKVTAIKFFKRSGNVGPHQGAIWSGTGKRLATVRFASETATGWQRATLATPVTLQAGQTYVVSYTSRGPYPADELYFNTGASFVAGPLTALAGVYSYSLGFPAQT